MAAFDTPRALLALLPLALGLVGCGSKSAPQPTPLGPGALLAGLTLEEQPGTPALLTNGRLERIVQRITSDRLEPLGIGAVSQFTVACPGFDGALDSPPPHELDLDGRALTFKPWSPELLAEGGFGPGSFSVYRDRVFFAPFDEQLSEDAELTYTARVQTRGARIDLDTSSFLGCVVPSACRADLGPEVWEPGAELLFRWAAHGSDALAGEQTLTIALDGQEIWSATKPCQVAGPRSHERVALPASGGRLTLSVSGAPSLAVLLAPHISAPSQLAAPSERPDIVLFLADTYRADNLEFKSGDQPLTPNLERFAADGLAFDQAWAPAPWTLPSQTSMLTGLYPYRHGVVHPGLALDGALVTLPEMLSAAGYRTAAVTEGVYILPRSGLDQGFESFEVGDQGDLEATLERARAVLAEDDGRPLLLFVHTFRAHSLYRADPGTLASLAPLFGPTPDPDWWSDAQIRARLHAAGLNADMLRSHEPVPPELAGTPAIGELAKLYRAGSRDVDTGFAQLLGSLDASGYADAVRIFTSDHGEAFGEHGLIGHGRSRFEEAIRVPLVIQAPGLTPARRNEPVSLIDLAPTICQLADLAVRPEWRGHSLLEPLPERRLYSFQCSEGTLELAPKLSVRAGQHKLLAERSTGGQLAALEAFDLASDPLEADPLEAAPWSAQLEQQANAELAALFEVLVAPDQVTLSGEEIRTLEAMGYLGSD